MEGPQLRRLPSPPNSPVQEWLRRRPPDRRTSLPRNAPQARRGKPWLLKREPPLLVRTRRSATFLGHRRIQFRQLRQARGTCRIRRARPRSQPRGESRAYLIRKVRFVRPIISHRTRARPRKMRRTPQARHKSKRKRKRRALLIPKLRLVPRSRRRNTGEKRKLQDSGMTILSAARSLLRAATS